MGNVIPAWGQVREKLNAIIAGVQWIEKETVAPNSIPINLQNMKYLAAGVRGCFSLFAPDYRDPRERETEAPTPRTLTPAPEDF